MTRRNINNSYQKTIDLNGILRLMNFGVACFICSGFFGERFIDNPYVDSITLILGLILCLQSHIVLRLERHNSDPFVLMMTYILTFHYSLRIFTLSIYPFSDKFMQYEYGPNDSNYALLYILIANTFIYAGLNRVKLGSSVIIETSNYKPVKPKILVIILFFSLLFSIFSQQVLPQSIAFPIDFIFNNFMSADIILTVLAVYIILFRKVLPVIYLKFVWAIALFLLGLQMMSFSRSGLLTLANTLLVLVLVLLPKFQVSRKHVFFIFALLPFLLSVAFTSYAISTTSRQIKGDNVTSLEEKKELLDRSYDLLKNDPRIDYFLNKALSRAGFFDFSAELIAHKQQYSRIFTLENYLQSIIDNVLTPGFDVFDQAKLSNSLKYADDKYAKFSKAEEIEGTYHTDQFTLYGEMYSIFGYVSVVILYIAVILIKMAYRYNDGLSAPMIALLRVFWLTIFFKLMNSFGLDWVLKESASMLVSFFVLSRLYPHKSHRAALRKIED